MDREIDVLLQATRSAGAAILKLQASGFSVERKANKDLVTQADLLANEILKSSLSEHFPTYGWLSEETADNKDRLHCQYVWVVDPIDGTIEYTHGIPEYAISVALVKDGLPVIGVVFNPATNELFYAVQGKGAWLNDKKLICDEFPTKDFLLLASRSEYKRGEWSGFEAAHRVKVVGSIAYKLALVAAGFAHATFSLSPKNEWDIAAGTLLVLEAGGVVTDKHKKQFIFNQENVLVDSIVASAANVSSDLFQLINEPHQ